MRRPRGRAGTGHGRPAGPGPTPAAGRDRPAAQPPTVGTVAVVIGLCAAIACAFATSFAGRFVFDDVNEIVTNRALVDLPPWRAMFVGKTLPARPLPYLTFAIDHRLHGDRPFGYHAVNLAVHAAAALALFDLVRTTLRGPRLREACGPRADVLAGIVATIWAVHPLQTQAVTYVYQRIESLAGMFVLLSLAAFARAWTAGSRPRWAATAVVAAAAAMASKESAVALPIMALAYDWCFLDRATWRERRPWHAALAATWLVLAANVWLERGEFQEFEPGNATPTAYLLTQGGVILHYLRLAAWPDRQCIDYGWPIAVDWRSALPACLGVFAALAAGIAGLAARRPWAFPVAFFFLALAPTSSLLPVKAAAAEHRMYLALAGLVALTVTAADRLLARRLAGRSALGGAAVAGLVIAALCLRTRERNRIYAEPERLWAEAVARNPANATAQARLAEVIFGETGDIERALPHAEAAVAADPRSDVFRNLCLACEESEQTPLQERLSRRGWQLDRAAFGPESREALESAGRLVIALRNLGSPEGADLAATLAPTMQRVLGPNHLTTLATGVVAAQAALGRGDAAAAERFARGSWIVLAGSNERPPNLLRQAADVLGESLRRLDREAEAVQVLRTTLAELASSGAHRELPGIAEPLADILVTRGDHAEAVGIYRQLFAAAVAAGADDVAHRLDAKLRAAQAASASSNQPAPAE